MKHLRKHAMFDWRESNHVHFPSGHGSPLDFRRNAVSGGVQGSSTDVSTHRSQVALRALATRQKRWTELLSVQVKRYA